MTKAIVDSSFLYLSGRKKGMSISYSRLANTLRSRFGATDLVICASFGDAPEQQTAINTIKAAESYGWRTFIRRTKRLGDNSAVAQIAAEVSEAYMRDQDVILVYGGRELRPVVDRALSRGVAVTLLGYPEAMSDALVSAVGSFVDLETIRNDICKVKTHG